MMSVPLPVKIGRIVAQNVIEDFQNKMLPWSGTEREWKDAPNHAARRAVMAFRARSNRARSKADEFLCAETAYAETVRLLQHTPGLGLSKAKFYPFDASRCTRARTLPIT